MLQVLVRAIEGLSAWSGRVAMGFSLLLVLITAFETGERYLLNRSSGAVQELTWHLYAAIFLLGFAQTLREDGHVRVDIFYNRLSERGQALVNILSMVFLLIPFCVMMIGFSWGWAVKAFLISERSPDPGGLPALWILKSLVPIAFGLLLLQGLAEIFKKTRLLRGRGQ
jgi:TRAP-type mannitol/chloroaromatic compound transport system permease small subunit